MLYKGTLITAASGSLGDSVFSRTRGTAYVRARVQPDQTVTTRRGYSRTAMTAIAARWESITATQRAAWQAFASGIPLPDRIGQALPRTGRAMFTRYNFRRQWATAAGTSMPWADDPPAQWSLPAALRPWLISWSANSLVLTRPAPHGYSISVNSVLLVWAGPAMAATRTTWPGPFNLLRVQTAPGGSASYTTSLSGTSSQLLSGQNSRIRIGYADPSGYPYPFMYGLMTRP